LTTAVRRPAVLSTAFAAAGVLAIVLGLVAEARTYARPDTGFLLDAAARVLAGQRLYVDVVEINPPLVIALNLPAVLAARLLGVSAISAYRAEVALAVLALLLAARPLLRRLLPDQPVTRAALGAAVAFVLFPLTGHDGAPFVVPGVTASLGTVPGMGMTFANDAGPRRNADAPPSPAAAGRSSRSAPAARMPRTVR